MTGQTELEVKYQFISDILEVLKLAIRLSDQGRLLTAEIAAFTFQFDLLDLSGRQIKDGAN